MMDWPIDELMDEDTCVAWLEKQLHPDGLKCPRCGSAERRVAKRPSAFPAYRCKACDRYHTILTGTIFERTQQPPSKLVLMLRGIATGVPTARLSRELSVCRQQMHTIRKRVQENVFLTRPTDVLAGSKVEADECYQNAGEKRGEALGSTGPATPPRQ